MRHSGTTLRRRKLMNRTEALFQAGGLEEDSPGSSGISSATSGRGGGRDPFRWTALPSCCALLVSLLVIGSASSAGVASHPGSTSGRREARARTADVLGILQSTEAVERGELVSEMVASTGTHRRHFLCLLPNTAPRSPPARLALRGGKPGASISSGSSRPAGEKHGKGSAGDKGKGSEKIKRKKRMIDELEGGGHEGKAGVGDHKKSLAKVRKSKIQGTAQAEEAGEESCESSFSVPDKVWCGAASDDPDRAAQHAITGSEESKDRFGAGESDDLVFVSTDEADADVVIRRAGDDDLGGAGSSGFAGMGDGEEAGNGRPSGVLDAEMAINFGWDAGWKSNDPEFNYSAFIQNPEDGGEGQEEALALVPPPSNDLKLEDEDDSGDIEDGEVEEYEWGLTSEPDPTGEAPTWLERVSEKMLRNESAPNKLFFLGKDGSIQIPQIKELKTPPDPTPGLSLEQGGAMWKWDEVEPDKGVFRGRWVLNSSDEHPINNPGYAAGEKMEDDEEEVQKVKWEDLEAEYDEEFLAEAEAQNPGSRQWLASGQFIRHSERDDFENFPCGPPADVLDGEYNEGGSKAVYVEGDDGEVTTFKPNRLDLRPILALSGSNVRTFEECIKMGYIPGMDKIMEMAEQDQDNEFEGADGGKDMGIAWNPKVASGLSRGFLLKKKGKGGDAKAAKWQRINVERPGVDGFADDFGDRNLAKIRRERTAMWSWCYVEQETERLLASKDPTEREVGEGLRLAAETEKFSPALIALWDEAEEKLAKTLAEGGEPVFPEWVQSAEEMHKHQRLKRVFEARCDRELQRSQGGELPYQIGTRRKHRVDTFDLLRAEATPEERTKWPYVPIPHWTYDLVQDSKRNSPTGNATFEMMVDDYMRNKNDGTVWVNNEPVLNSTRRDELLERMFQVIDDIDQGRRPKPDDWPISWEEEQRLAGIDPCAPCTPNQVGEGIHMWGLHPEGRKCGNTYCRYCYTTEHEGDQIDNPKFQGRLLSDLSNDELHELGINKRYASLPKHVLPVFRDPPCG